MSLLEETGANPMGEAAARFKSDLRISYKWVAVLSVILGLGLFFLSQILSEPSDQFKILLLAALFYALSGLIWLLDSWQPWLGRSSMIIFLVVIVYLADSWLEIPGFLTLMVIPTALAAALFSLPVAAVTAIGETIFLLLLNFSDPGLDSATTLITLSAIWVILGVMYAVYQPVHQVAQWAWEYFQRAQVLLEETQERQARLEQALDDLTHANRQLVLANEKVRTFRLTAEEAQKSKAAFVAKVSHEFRTPLNIIIGMVNLMVEAPEVYEGEFPPKALEHLRVVYRNCQHLSGMIDDVLDLSQTEAGQMTLQRKEADLAEIIDTAMRVVQPLMTEKGLSCQLTIPKDLPEVYCDRTRIRQVILNLVSNAARFTTVGGITVKVTRQEELVLVSVTDTGPGILPEDADKIFEPFSQASSMSWQEAGGSGLGLSISKQFIELHGGRMWFESEPGVSATFFFELPISPPQPPPLRPEHWVQEDWIWHERQSRPQFPESHYRPRMVICDETGDVYPAFSHHSDEIEFVDTRDLDQALQELERCPAQALVLNTPSPDNLWSLVDRARQGVPDTPIIGCAYPSKIEQALEAGAVGYLTKPMTLTDLSRAIQVIGKPIKRVLVVDDDPDVRELLTFNLRVIDNSIEVIAAEKGEQALDALRARHPDLMLLDVVMPGMNGWQLLSIKREDETIKNIPTLMVSAQDARDGQVISRIFMATMGEGLSFGKLLDCSHHFATRLLQSN